MIDATHIADTLYQGSFPMPGAPLRRAGIDVLVLCAEEAQPPASAYPGVEVVYCPLDDACPTPDEKRRAGHAARVVARAVRGGKRVLVTCMQGRNRSGLVVALALRCLYPRQTPDRIIARVKSRRENALTNHWFVEALRRESGSVTMETQP